MMHLRGGIDDETRRNGIKIKQRINMAVNQYHLTINQAKILNSSLPYNRRIYKMPPKRSLSKVAESRVSSEKPFSSCKGIQPKMASQET